MAFVPSQQVLTQDEMGRIAPPIMTLVGADGVNAPGDAFVIQSLLKDRLPKPRTPLAVKGVMDAGTVLATEVYQAVMSMNPTTGVVLPGSMTYCSLASRPLVNQPPPVSRRGPYGPGIGGRGWGSGVVQNEVGRARQRDARAVGGGKCLGRAVGAG